MYHHRYAYKVSFWLLNCREPNCKLMSKFLLIVICRSLRKQIFFGVLKDLFGVFSVGTESKLSCFSGFPSEFLTSNWTLLHSSLFKLSLLGWAWGEIFVQKGISEYFLSYLSFMSSEQGFPIFLKNSGHCRMSFEKIGHICQKAPRNWFCRDSSSIPTPFITI